MRRGRVERARDIVEIGARLGERLQLFGEIESATLAGAVIETNGPAMSPPQGVAQHAIERREAGARADEGERLVRLDALVETGSRRPGDMEPVAPFELLDEMPAHPPVLMQAYVHLEIGVFLGMAGERIMAFQIFVGDELQKLPRAIRETLRLDPKAQDVGGQGLDRMHDRVETRAGVVRRRNHERRFRPADAGQEKADRFLRLRETVLRLGRGLTLERAMPAGLALAGATGGRRLDARAEQGLEDSLARRDVDRAILVGQQRQGLSARARRFARNRRGRRLPSPPSPERRACAACC